MSVTVAQIPNSNHCRGLISAWYSPIRNVLVQQLSLIEYKYKLKHPQCPRRQGSEGCVGRFKFTGTLYNLMSFLVDMEPN